MRITPVGAISQISNKYAGCWSSSNFRAEYQESIKQQQLIIIDLFYETLSAQDRLIILNDLAKSAESLVKLATQRFRLGDISAQDLELLEHLEAVEQVGYRDWETDRKSVV